MSWLTTAARPVSRSPASTSCVRSCSCALRPESSREGLLRPARLAARRLSSERLGSCNQQSPFGPSADRSQRRPSRMIPPHLLFNGHPPPGPHPPRARALSSWRAIRASRVALRRAACPWWCSHHAALISSRRWAVYALTLSFHSSSCSSRSGRRSCDARLEISRPNSRSTASTRLPSLACLHLVRLWPKEYPPSSRPILPDFLLLARVVAAPRFHQLVEPAVPVFSAAFVGFPGLPPLPPRPIPLVAAVRHAALHCGRSWRATSPTRTSGKQVVERQPCIFPVVCRPPCVSALSIKSGSFLYCLDLHLRPEARHRPVTSVLYWGGCFVGGAVARGVLYQRTLAWLRSLHYLVTIG